MSVASGPETTARRSLWAIAIAQLMALSLWFSASAVSPALEEAWELAPVQVPFLTLAVQLGFVVGALASAVLNLADIIPTRRLFVISAVVGAMVNLGLLGLGEGDIWWATALRFVTGAALAGVYPTGMKAMAGWFRERRGAALGVLVGALTVGSALPHLIRGTGLPWRGVLGAASGLAVASAVIMWFVTDGPYEVPPRSFSIDHVRKVIANRGFRLSTSGYLGHMWELYAMWTWVGAYIASSAASSGSPETNAPLLTFFAIAIGGPSAWYAGRLADRAGRTLAAGGALLISGVAGAVTPFVFGRSIWLLVALLAVWGGTVVADSAQFSAMVTETVPDEMRGTALTLQTALGFLLTLGSIALVPLLADVWSWQVAFLALVPGPILGVVAMFRLRGSEWAPMLAGGRG